MSQKKVDAYKAEKANREQLMKKEKRMLLLEKAAAVLVCAALICWIGFSVYSNLTGTQEEAEAVTATTQVDTTAIDNYLNSMPVE